MGPSPRSYAGWVAPHRLTALLALTLSAAILGGCGASTGTASPDLPTSTTSTSVPPTDSPSPSSSPSVSTSSTRPPPWLGTRPLQLTADGFGVQQPTPQALRVRRFTLPDTVDPLPGSGFASRITAPAPDSVITRSTWAPGCPVAADQLAWIRLTFWGFDDQRHTGELLANTDAAEELVTAFRALYAAHFPIEEMRISTKAEQTAAPTGDGNDTGAFNCRPVRGETVFSQHAYGRAVDVNPFQNPYERRLSSGKDLVLPELAGAYTDRSWERPGMILAGGPVTRAFASIGWTWGGSWRSLKDLQHFSANGG